MIPMLDKVINGVYYIIDVKKEKTIWVFCFDNLPHNVIFDGLLNFYSYCHNNNSQYGVLLWSVSHIFVIVSIQLTKRKMLYTNIRLITV